MKFPPLPVRKEKKTQWGVLWEGTGRRKAVGATGASKQVILKVHDSIGGAVGKTIARIEERGYPKRTTSQCERTTIRKNAQINKRAPSGLWVKVATLPQEPLLIRGGGKMTANSR